VLLYTEVAKKQYKINAQRNISYACGGKSTVKAVTLPTYS